MAAASITAFVIGTAIGIGVAFTIALRIICQWRTLACFIGCTKNKNPRNEIELKIGRKLLHSKRILTFAANGRKFRSKRWIGNDIDGTFRVFGAWITVAWILAITSLASICIVCLRYAVRTSQRFTFFNLRLTFIETLENEKVRCLFEKYVFFCPHQIHSPHRCLVSLSHDLVDIVLCIRFRCRNCFDFHDIQCIRIRRTDRYGNHSRNA